MIATVPRADEIAAFAASVRAALGDLPPDDVDELTDGLEADLTARLEDEAEADLGDPAEYAAELRRAAGVPDRRRRGALRADAQEQWGRWRDRWDRWTRRPLVAGAAEILRVLRPVWWVLRAWAMYQPVAWLTGSSLWPTSPVHWLLAAGVVVVSVQWGRGRWLPASLVRGVNIAVTVVAVLALPFLLGRAAAPTYIDAYDGWDPMQSSGLLSNGKTITNLFVYDENGEPLTDVQVFDQDGDPLLTVGDPSRGWVPVDGPGLGGTWQQFALSPNPRDPGSSGWNVYPLYRSELPADWQAIDPQLEPERLLVDPAPAPFPFERIRPLTPVDAGAADAGATEVGAGDADAEAVAGG